MCPLQIIRNRKAARQRWSCHYCRQPMWRTNLEGFARRHGLTRDQAELLQLTAEHLRARRDGGRNSYANIAAACLYCNRMRHQNGDALSAADYARFVRSELRGGRWHGILINPDL
ncbi:MAG: HNH endonuclease [Sphingopyxis sp.]